MKSRQNQIIRFFQKCFPPLLIALLAATACSPNSSEAVEPPVFSNNYQIPISVTELQLTEVTFLVRIPLNTPDDQAIYITLLDEVTGLPYNSRNIILQALDQENYGVTLTAPVGSILKYRYSRGDVTNNGEYTALGQPVRYRMHFVDGPGLVTDIVARWSDTLSAEAVGRVRGEVIDNETSKPVINALIVAGGVYAYSDAAGNFRIDGLPVGKHTVTVYSVNGAYKTFKQEVVIANDSETPFSARITASKMVSVTFNVTVPKDTVPTIPVLLAGNLFQLGNTFSDLSGGISVLSSRIPALKSLGNGQYALTLSLPAGADIRYKYTLGDGLWNAEHSDTGSFVIRQLIIPEDLQTLNVNDTVQSWLSSDSPPIWFDVNINTETALTDELYIQFKLQDWLEPVRMWKGADNRWGYLLSSPTNFAAPVEYRFCRNSQCGNSPGVAIPIITNSALLIPTDRETETLVTYINAWLWSADSSAPPTVPADNVYIRESNFKAGIALSSNYHPSWGNYTQNSMEGIKSANANYVILTPTWSLGQSDLPTIKQMPATDILFNDLEKLSKEAERQSLEIALMPTLNYPALPQEWWLEATRDFVWWQQWFEQYRAFLIHHAMIAEQLGIPTLIIGNGYISPALPNGTLIDGTTSNVPPDAAKRWQDLVIELRTFYSGNLSWALPYTIGEMQYPTFLHLVDEVYLQISGPIGNTKSSPYAYLSIVTDIVLDEDIFPFYQEIDKPIIIALAYPSANGGIAGCVRSPVSGCLSNSHLSPFEIDIPSAELDLQEQVDIYNAFLSSINERDWIAGFVSEEYFPIVQLADKSGSIHGKPAERILWYWFREMLGINQ